LKLTVGVTDSLGETIQRTFPGVRVVKTLNTVTAAVMVDPVGVGAGDHTVFVAGNDSEAKAHVAALLRDFGWGTSPRPAASRPTSSCGWARCRRSGRRCST
jgi:predicted dinucleotide-binding enzyme